MQPAGKMLVSEGREATEMTFDSDAMPAFTVKEGPSRQSPLKVLIERERLPKVANKYLQVTK